MTMSGDGPLLDLSGLAIDLPGLLLLAAGLGWAAGLRLYALIFVLGLAGRYGIRLPGGLEVLTHPMVLAVAGILLLVEFFADKVPWLDSLWDSVHTFIRIPAGAALAAAVVGDHGAASQLAFGLLGGTLAAGTHLAKAGSRAMINASPEPVTNILASLTEEGLFVAGLWLLYQHPWAFAVLLVLFALVAVWLIVRGWRLLRSWLQPRTTAGRPPVAGA